MSRNVILSQTDRAILELMWEWKFLTTLNVANRFYRNSSPMAAYKRLWKLSVSKVIDSISTPDRQRHFWMLNSNSFRELVRPSLSELDQNGFKSENLEHDFIVNSLHLGEFIHCVPEGIELFSEQRLRRENIEFFPTWVPVSKIHRADGYTRIASGKTNRILAFEVELSPKRRELYENVGRFYNEDTEVDEVIWVVTSLAEATHIHSRIEKVVGKNADIHSYFLLNDFLESHWQTCAALGKSKGQSLFEIHGIDPEKWRKAFPKVEFFDSRKTIIESNRSKNAPPPSPLD